MQDDGEPKNVAVIGGGISGLSAAWLLEQQGKKVTLYHRNGKYSLHKAAKRRPPRKPRAPRTDGDKPAPKKE